MKQAADTAYYVPTTTTIEGLFVLDPAKGQGTQLYGISVEKYAIDPPSPSMRKSVFLATCSLLFSVELTCSSSVCVSNFCLLSDYQKLEPPPGKKSDGTYHA